MIIRVILPFHLQNLAKCPAEVSVEPLGDPTIGSVLDAIEAQFPNLKGTIRDHGTLKRRPFLRFFADGEDISAEPYETELPQAVQSGVKPFMIVGAIAGG